MPNFSPRISCAPSPASAVTSRPSCSACSTSLTASGPSATSAGSSGLFPPRTDSGGAERPRQRITQGGNDRIKRALMGASDTARKIDLVLAELCWRLMTGKGHHHKQALCAVANRLVNRIFSVLRSGRPHVLRDPDGHAISIAEAKALFAARYHVPEAIRATRRANRAQLAA